MTAQGELETLNRQLDFKVQQLEALIDFGRVLAGVGDPAEVAQRLGLTVAGQWLLTRWAVVALREGRAPLVRSKGLGGLDAVAFDRRQLAGWRRPFLSGGDEVGLVDELAGAGVAAVVPLISGETTFGFVALGPRPGGQPWQDDDLAYVSGLAGQAVVAFEAAWQAEEASHWRLESEARDAWRRLDRWCRLVFLAAARSGPDERPDEGAIERILGESLADSGYRVSLDRIRVAVERLTEVGALDRDEDGALSLIKREWLGLPDARKPLAEIARESLDRIGAYEIVERIGGGGMGEVFRANNVHDGSVAAVKLLYPSEAASDDLRRRFEREGELVAGITHPNVVRLRARGEQDGRLYLAMEYLEGEPLSAVIRRRGRLAESEAIAVARELAAALAALHSAGVVHRDVKSGNIFVCDDGRVVLLDLGLARDVAGSSLTGTNQVVGTLAYMSPEQLRGTAVDEATDVWSFGVVLHEMLAGRVPWQREDGFGLAIEILSEEPTIAPEVLRGQSEVVVELLRSCLTVDPTARPRRGEELAGRLGVGAEKAPSVEAGSGSCSTVGDDLPTIVQPATPPEVSG